MSVIVFDFAGRSYASGLYWQEVPSKGLRHKLDDLCSDFSTKHGVVVPNKYKDSYVVGFAEEEDKISFVGSYAVAAELLLLIEEKSWSGVFKLNNDVWLYIAVKNGIITHDSDVYSEDDSDLLSRLEEDMQYNEYDVYFSPKGTVKGSSDLDIYTLLLIDPSPKSAVRNISYDWLKYLLGFLVIIAIAVTFFCVRAIDANAHQRALESSVKNENQQSKQWLKSLGAGK